MRQELLSDMLKPNAGWVLHREEIYTVRDGSCNLYALLDACSVFCFGYIIAADLPARSDVERLLGNAQRKAGMWPKWLILAKDEPYIDELKAVSESLGLSNRFLPYKDIRVLVQPFIEGFEALRSDGHTARTVEELEELRALVPATYSPCPCASGKKFKFCCKPIFSEVVYAMCALEEGDLDEALSYMQKAETKVGATAEALCRYAICWSQFDKTKYHAYLEQAMAINPNHPRLNYILGIDAKIDGNYSKAIEYYQNAIAYYSKDDRYHLNEVYNNLGGAYFELKDYKKAKEAWECALVLFPTDAMVKQNLTEFIYDNLAVPNDIRELSPFIKKYLEIESRFYM